VPAFSGSKYYVTTLFQFSITVEGDLSNELIDEERKLTQTDNAISSDETSNETEKTNLLLGLAEKGILGYFRLVAKRH
jgi:hypothetical protein